MRLSSCRGTSHQSCSSSGQRTALLSFMAVSQVGESCGSVQESAVVLRAACVAISPPTSRPFVVVMVRCPPWLRLGLLASPPAVDGEADAAHGQKKEAGRLRGLNDERR